VTDVTGFGLIGHALEMAAGLGPGPPSSRRALPLLPASTAVRAGVRTGASTRNWASYGPVDVQTVGVADWRRDLLTDPRPAAAC
jgi:selenide,water dikinase